MIKRPRRHDDKHLQFIRGLPCVVCGNNIETQAAHVRFTCPAAGKRHVGGQEKPDDKWALPLCGRCHDEQHGGKEAAFWEGRNINPIFVCLALFAASGDHELGEQIVSNARVKP